MLNNNQQTGLFALGLGILCLLTYFPSFQSDFKIDDFTYLDAALNPNYSHWFEVFFRSDSQHYNPINFLLNTLLFKLWNKNVIYYHLFNTGLFYLNCFLLFIISIRLTRNFVSAAFAAILFCLHPINAEIINQIVFNTVLVSAILFQIAVLKFDDWLVHRRLLSLVMSLLITFLSLLTLETSVLIPPTLFLWMWLVRKHSFWQCAQKTSSFWLITFIYIIAWKFITLGNDHSTDFIQKLTYFSLTPVTFLGTLASLGYWYIQKLFFPFDAVWIYATQPLPFEPALVWLIGLMTVFTFLVFLTFGKLSCYPAVQFALFWFVSGFVFLFPGSLTHAEAGMIVEPYWFYVNSMGFFILMGILLASVKNYLDQRFFILVWITICGYLMVGTQKMNIVTRSEKKYSEYWLGISMNPMPLTALAKIAHMDRDYVAALAYYQIYLKTFAYSPFNVNPPWRVEIAMAAMYAELGQFDSAKNLIHRVLEINPKAHQAYIVLANVAVYQKDYSLAERYFIKALELDSNNMLALASLVDLYIIIHQEQKALPLLEILAQSKIRGIDRVTTFTKLAVLKYRAKDFEGTVTAIDTVLRQSNDPMTYRILIQGFEYHQIHDMACRLSQEAISLYPLDSELRLYYGVALGNLGQYEEALIQFKKGQQISPKDKRFLENMTQLKNLLN